ncbi:MAG: hypothetical protein ACFB0E_01495 [Leptolyngbyaceae cyanobacterium]
MQLTSQPLGERLSTQNVGVSENDVFCVFLGEVWKMRSRHVPSSERLNATAMCEIRSAMPLAKADDMFLSNLSEH